MSSPLEDSDLGFGWQVEHANCAPSNQEWINLMGEIGENGLD